MSAPREGAQQAGILGLLTVYLVLLFGIPTRLVFAPLGSAGAPSLIFGLGCAFVWLLAQLWRRTSEPGSRRPIRFALALFLVCVGISYAWAMTRPIESDELSQADVALLSILSMAGVFLVAHDGLVRLRDIDTIARRLSLAGGLMATLGLVQFVTRQALVDRISIPGLTAINGTGVVYRNGLVRVAGTATHPIEFGALLTVLLPIAIYCGLHPRPGRRRLRRWLPAAAIFVALALSGSRSAYVGFALVFVVLLAGWPRRRRWLIGSLGVVGVALMCLAVPPLFRSVRSMFGTAKDDPSIASRTDSYAIATQFFERWPLFGHGMGTFLPKYRIFDNAYLGLLVSVGIVGAIAFVALPLTAVWLLLRRRRLWSDAQSRDLALSIAAGVVAGAASMAFFDAFGFPMTMGTVFFALGLAGAFVSVRGRSPVPVELAVAPGPAARPPSVVRAVAPPATSAPRIPTPQSAGSVSDGGRAP